MEKYADMLKLSRPRSSRAKMSLVDRGAQFAAFAALPGFDGELKKRTQEEENEDLLQTGPGPDPGDD